MTQQSEKNGDIAMPLLGVPNMANTIDSCPLPPQLVPQQLQP